MVVPIFNKGLSHCSAIWGKLTLGWWKEHSGQLLDLRFRAGDAVSPACFGEGLQLRVKRMKTSESKSEAKVLSWKKVACSLRVGTALLPRVEEFKHLKVLFMNQGKTKRELLRLTGAAATVMRESHQTVSTSELGQSLHIAC